MFLAILDNPPGRQLIEARDVPQQWDARRVQVNADKVDATGDDRLEHFFELLGIDVVLVKPDADILGIDLDELGQRVLEPAADRDAAAQGRVEVGELVAADLARRIDAGACLVDDDVGELCAAIGSAGWGLGGSLRRRRRMPRFRAVATVDASPLDLGPLAG